MGSGGLVQSGMVRRCRIAGGRIPAQVALDDAWVRTDGETFERATPTAALIAFAIGGLQAEKLELAGDVLLVRHQPGDRGLPASDGSAGLRFAIDLTEARSSVDGGVLLFLDDTGRGPGWRAEAGAMTVWDGSDPELTELVPGAPGRLTLVGQARAVFPEV